MVMMLMMFWMMFWILLGMGNSLLPHPLLTLLISEEVEGRGKGGGGGGGGAVPICFEHSGSLALAENVNSS